MEKKHNSTNYRSIFFMFSDITRKKKKKIGKNIKYQRAIYVEHVEQALKCAPNLSLNVTKIKRLCVFFFVVSIFYSGKKKIFIFVHRFIPSISINKLKSECIQLLSVHIM